MIDYSTLLIIMGFSAGTLMLALLIGWREAKSDIYLFYWAAGIGSVIVAVTLMAMRNPDTYVPQQQIVPYFLLQNGLGLVFCGARKFYNNSARPIVGALISLALALSTTVSLTLGYTGHSVILLNVGCGVILMLCGYEYWRARSEAPLAITTIAALYLLCGASFHLCAVVTILNGDWVMTALATGWAEDVNSIMCVVGLTGIGVLSLMLNHQRHARRHEEAANTDALTGTLNRRALFSRYPEGSDAEGLAVIMLDLDHFKQINDHLGHAAGDRVLQQFAAVLSGHLRPGDCAARLGGEEFCAVMPGLEADQVKKIAEEIRTAFADLKLAIGATNSTATVSVGMAIAGQGEKFNSVLSRADDALYKAKRAGRNQVKVAALRLVA